MLEDELTVNLRQHDTIAIIDLVGDVTTFAEEKINGAYQEATQQGLKLILFNFRANDYINSAGIAILIGIVNEVNNNKQRLAFSGLSQHFQKIFRMVGLSGYADIYQDEAEALQHFSADAPDVAPTDAASAPRPSDSGTQ